MSRNPSIPHEAIIFFRDGNMWLCARPDYQDLQLSITGDGPTFDEAYRSLLDREARPRRTDLEVPLPLNRN
jgi:hypothetical protein